jgi:hypothetical protein
MVRPSPAKNPRRFVAVKPFVFHPRRSRRGPGRYLSFSAGRVGRLCRSPAVGQELLDPAVGMGAHPVKHVAEVPVLGAWPPCLTVPPLRTTDLRSRRGALLLRHGIEIPPPLSTLTPAGRVVPIHSGSAPIGAVLGWKWHSRHSEASVNTPACRSWNVPFIRSFRRLNACLLKGAGPEP